MINSKKDYEEYLRADMLANHKKKNKANLIGDYTYNYLNLMRKLEYYTNCKKGFFAVFISRLLFIRYKRMSVKTGIQIGINTFGKGLGLFHYGSIIVNPSARFGNYCVIQGDVNISANVVGGMKFILLQERKS